MQASIAIGQTHTAKQDVITKSFRKESANAGIAIPRISASEKAAVTTSAAMCKYSQNRIPEALTVETVVTAVGSTPGER